MNVSNTLAAVEGERRKRAALSLLAARREILIRRGRRALLSALIEQGEATCDNVRAAVESPAGIDPKAFGAVPGELAEAGIIEPIRFTKSVRAEAHRRPVQVWKLADRAAALRWLAMHPDFPELESEPADLGDLFTTTTTNKNAPDAETLGAH